MGRQLRRTRACRLLRDGLLRSRVEGGQDPFGLLLVVAYGVGLARTLTAAGFAVVKAGTGMMRLLDRRPRWGSGPMAALMRRTAPLGSAFVVVSLGVGLVFKGAASPLG